MAHHWQHQHHQHHHQQDANRPQDHRHSVPFDGYGGTQSNDENNDNTMSGQSHQHGPPASLKRPRNDAPFENVSYPEPSYQQHQEQPSKRVKRIHDRGESWSSFSSTASVGHFNHNFNSGCHSEEEVSVHEDAFVQAPAHQSFPNPQKPAAILPPFHQQHEQHFHHTPQAYGTQIHDPTHCHRSTVERKDFLGATDGSVISISTATTASPAYGMDYQSMNSLLGNLHHARRRHQQQLQRQQQQQQQEQQRQQQGPQQQQLHHHHQQQHNQHRQLQRDLQERQQFYHQGGNPHTGSAGSTQASSHPIQSHPHKNNVVSLRVDSNLF